MKLMHDTESLLDPYILYTHYIFLVVVDKVEKKWKSLRTQYTRERGKVKKRKTGLGVEDVYETKWQYYSHLSFLDDYVTPKESQSNLKVC